MRFSPTFFINVARLASTAFASWITLWVWRSKRREEAGRIAASAWVEADEFAALRNLINGYFHEDYDIISENPDDVIAEYKADVFPQDMADSVRDIDTFITRYGEDDAQLDAAFERVFSPEGPVLGDDPGTVREGLAWLRTALLRGTEESDTLPDRSNTDQ